MFEGVVGGPGLVGALTAVNPADLDDGDLIEAVRGWERLASWVAAGQLGVIAEFARRRPRDYVERGPGGHADRGDPRVPQVSEYAVDEVAAALRLSRPAAGGRLHVAVELAGRLPGTAAALAAGVIDVPKARAVVDAVTALDDRLAAAVEARVLPAAGRRTVGQLRAVLAQAVLSVDPAAAEDRHTRATAGREVTIRPLADGMAGLWALLPADAAAAVYTHLDRIARRAPATDIRGMDARRADALVMTVLAGTTGAAALPPADSAASSTAATSTRPARSTGPGGARCGSCGAVPDGLAGPVPRLRADVHVTVPAATALGLSDQPGELTGHGPIPASMARRLTTAGNWRRVTLDPESGTVTHVGRDTYTPSAALADLVRARDRSCRFPGCRHPARRCDLDHLIPWPGGPTSAENLVALCRHHHRLKHQTQWTVEATVGAGLSWTSPTGHRYTTQPSRPG